MATGDQVAVESVKEEFVKDDFTAPTFFVDGIFGMQLRDGVAVLNLSQHVFPAPQSDGGEAFNSVVLRLAIPAPAFVRMVDWFVSAKVALIEQGAVIPVEQSGAPTK